MYKHIQTFAIGGLQNIGFLNDNLIVLSTQGIGIFNCLTGEKIGRDNKDWWGNFDEVNNTINVTVNGENKIVKTFGLFNPNEALPSISPTDWKLLVTPPQPDDPPFEKYMVRSVFLISPYSRIMIIPNFNLR
jgi:hypothetical protein